MILVHKHTYYHKLTFSKFTRVFKLEIIVDLQEKNGYSVNMVLSKYNQAIIYFVRIAAGHLLNTRTTKVWHCIDFIVYFNISYDINDVLFIVCTINMISILTITFNAQC